ncbi:MAG: cbb3-type cytochrome c oxidase subunit 3 [Burkholderiaceae bacterium]
MDLNLIRSLVTVLAFIVFMAIVVRAWRASNRASHAEAAALPFADEPVPVAKSSSTGDRASVIPAHAGIHPLRTAVDPGVRRDDGTQGAVV